MPIAYRRRFHCVQNAEIEIIFLCKIVTVRFDTGKSTVYNRCMNYIVFDLEWNQCPDGKQKEKHDLPFEVLEIGAVKLNDEKQETGRFHEYIRPSVYTRLHFRTREIIHIDPDVLARADYFPVVIARFEQWCGEDARYCTWGSLDLLELQRNIRYHGLPDFFPFPLKYYDLQKIFSLAYEDGKSRRTLEYAVDMLGIPKDIPFHEALSDAYYAASVIRHLPDDRLLPFFSFDYFRIPQGRNEEIFEVFENYAKFISHEFPSRHACMRDRTVLSMKCYACGGRTTKKIPWFSAGGKNYTCLCVCPEHGYLKGKIRVKKAEDEKGYFCVKTQKLIDVERAQELADSYARKKMK